MKPATNSDLTGYRHDQDIFDAIELVAEKARACYAEHNMTGWELCNAIIIRIWNNYSDHGHIAPVCRERKEGL